jgi:hypothetical protein
MTIRSTLPKIAALLLCGGCAAQSGTATTQPSLTPQEQIEYAQLGLAAAEGVLTALQASNVIQPAQAARITPFETAAAAALAKLSADQVAGSTGVAADLDSFNAALAAYTQAVAEAKGQ